MQGREGKIEGGGAQNSKEKKTGEENRERLT